MKAARINMVFSEHTYSILVVSAGDKFNTVISRLLPVNQYWPVVIVKDAEDARRLFFEKGFDIVLINAQTPYNDDIQLAVDICDKSEAGVILLTPGDYYEEICSKTIPHGIMTVSKPVTEHYIRQSLSLVCAMAERMKNLMKKQYTVDEKIEEIRIVNKAKWLLIDHARMTEPEAHRFIEKKAMDDRVSKKDVALRIISQYS